MKLRLAPDAQQVLVAAVADARKRKHAEVTREHVLAALVDLEELAPKLSSIRIFRREIAALVAARLARLPETGGYRDANVVVPLSPPVRKILEEQRRGIVFARVITACDLLDALMDEPKIAELIAEARLDLDTFKSTLEEAMAIAVERKHTVLRPEHVLRVLVEERWLARAIDAVGGDVDVLRRHLDTALDSFFIRRQTNIEIEATKVLALLIQRVLMHGRQHLGHATSDVFVIFALQDAEASAIFKAAGVAPRQLLFALAHGVETKESEGTEDMDGLLVSEVVFHNDDFTTQELVVHLLTQVFELAHARAVKVMLSIHTNGEGVAGTYPTLEARRRARDATTIAREAGFPLRITVRALADSSPETASKTASKTDH